MGPTDTFPPPEKELGFSRSRSPLEDSPRGGRGSLLPEAAARLSDFSVTFKFAEIISPEGQCRSLPPNLREIPKLAVIDLDRLVLFSQFRMQVGEVFPARVKAGESRTSFNKGAKAVPVTVPLMLSMPEAGRGRP